MVSISQKGDFSNSEKWLKKSAHPDFRRILEQYGKQGVAALASATPVDTGKTANSWGYTVEIGREKSTIYWTNSNVNDGVKIAVIIQYGHATGTGAYVEGIDYINPTMRPVFEKIADAGWKAVTTL